MLFTLPAKTQDSVVASDYFIESISLPVSRSFSISFQVSTKVGCSSGWRTLPEKKHLNERCCVKKVNIFIAYQ